MSDRYSKLFALPENLYSVGAPVVIAAGALQKDNQTGKVFAQLKIRNIQNKSIKAATVKITPFDTVGKPIGGAVDYQYLDLSAGRDADFGQKTPVMLKEAATRSFAVSVSEVIFSDNSIWTASNEAWEPLSTPVTPEKEFTDSELAKQYRAKYGADCKCVFKKEKDLWRCACGAINHDSEKNCHSCQREAATLAALNVDELKADRDKRLAAEQKKAAEKKAAAEEQAKRTKKIVMVALPVIAIVIVAGVVISNFLKAQQEEAARLEAYNAAVTFLEEGKYVNAAVAFERLGDYRDSVELFNEANYQRAVSLLEDRRYSEATDAFTALGNYKDSVEQIQNVQNQENAHLELIEKYRTMMKTSISDTYREILAAGDLDEVNELIKIVKPYIPYCGSFTFGESGLPYTSDFILNDFNEVMWRPIPEDERYIIYFSGVLHYYDGTDEVTWKVISEAEKDDTTTYDTDMIHIYFKVPLPEVYSTHMKFEEEWDSVGYILQAAFVFEDGQVDYTLNATNKYYHETYGIDHQTFEIKSIY